MRGKRRMSRTNSLHWATTVPSKRPREAEPELSEDSGAPAPTPAQVVGTPPLPELPAPAEPEPPAAAREALLIVPVPAADASEALPIPAPHQSPVPPETGVQENVISESPAVTAPQTELQPTSEQSAPSVEQFELQQTSEDDDDDDSAPEGIAALKEIFKKRLAIIQVIPFFALYVFLCGVVYKKSYPLKTIRLVGVSTISAFIIGTFDDLGQIIGGLRKKNTEVVKKRRGWVRTFVLLVIFGFCCILFCNADPEPTPCDCKENPVDESLSWRERNLVCDVDLPYEVFGGLVAYVLFGESPIKQMPSIGHSVLLGISSILHHFLFSEHIGLDSSKPLTASIVFLCIISCSWLLWQKLGDNDKPKTDVKEFFSELLHSRKNVKHLMPFFFLYMYLCNIVHKRNSPPPIVRSVGVSTISFFTIGAVEELLELSRFLFSSTSQQVYKRMIRRWIMLLGCVACFFLYFISSPDYKPYTCICPESSTAATSLWKELAMTYEIFGALIAYSYAIGSPINYLPSIGHLVCLVLGFALHVFLSDSSNFGVSSSTLLSATSVIVCALYFFVLIILLFLKSRKPSRVRA